MNFKFPDSETQMFKDLSDIFILERAGKIINDKIYAFFCSNEYQSSIQTIDIKPLKFGVIAKYETNSQRMRQQTTGNISIGNIGGSAIIGNQQYATIDNSSIQNLKEIISNKTEDKEMLEKLLNRIETIIEDNQPVSKGTFSKFAYIFKKYPDIVNVVGATLLKWLSSMN